MSDVVLDSSAVLAYIQSEPGMDTVERLVAASDDAFIAAVNLAEVVTKLVDRGADDPTIRAGLATLHLLAIPFDEELAYETGFLRRSTRQAGLSLGDRACLALGVQLGAPVLTTDRSWALLGLPVEVRVIR